MLLSHGSHCSHCIYRRPSFESPVPAAAVPVAGGISFDDDPFGPPTNPGGGGAATAAYQARLKVGQA